MKTITPLALALLAAASNLRADVIAQWNFNNTNTLPSIGSGNATPVGGVTTGFVNDTGSSDTIPGGKAWSTSGYPSATNNNRTAGVRFDVNTTDYENISVRWDQKHSATSSRYVRFQYTVDGYTFSDFPAIAATGTSYVTNTMNLSAITGATNNPLFGFQIVAEFESTATGSGTNAYVATSNTSSYASSGTIHFDMVTVSGTLLPGVNNPPRITGVPDQTLRMDQSSGPLAFTVYDYDEPAANLALGKASSDAAVVPLDNITFGGSGGNRTVTVIGGSQAGTASITMTVTDSGGKSAGTNFLVTVLPANTPPTISAIPPTNTLAGTPTTALPFTVGDLETAAGTLILSGSSGNPILVPDGNIALGGSGASRTVTVTPAGGQSGVAPITVTVSDGTNTASSTFGLLVRPSPNVLLLDPFSYPDGSVVTNSGFLWDHNSGTYGGSQVINGQLQVTADQTEDVIADLAGAPYVTGNQTALYAALKMTFLTLPKVTPDYFAHFANGSTYRGRLYTSTPTNAAPGSFRLLVANGSDTVTNLPADLNTNTTYTVVLRYALDAPSTTLWLNPVAETDPSVTAIDAVTATRIGSFGFRQSAGVGAAILVDDLKVGLSFAAVTGATLNPIPLHLESIGGRVVLSWTDPNFALQAAPAVVGVYTNVPGATSPYTNSPADAARFFRLKGN